MKGRATENDSVPNRQGSEIGRLATASHSQNPPTPFAILGSRARVTMANGTRRAAQTAFGLSAMSSSFRRIASPNLNSLTLAPAKRSPDSSVPRRGRRQETAGDHDPLTNGTFRSPGRRP